EIVAFEQQCGAVSLCAGVGKAVAKIELRRMPALAVSLETFDREAPDAFIDGKLGDFTLQKKIVEEILRGKWQNVEAACENDACFKPHGRGSQSAVRMFELTDERGSAALIEYERNDSGRVDEHRYWPHIASMSSLVTSRGLGPASARARAASSSSRSANGRLSRSRFSSLRSAWAIASVMLVLRRLASSRASLPTSGSRMLMPMA